MHMALRVTTRVLASGRIEIDTPELAPGATVELIILVPDVATPAPRSAIDILAEAPGQRAFTDAAAVEAYLRQERDAWEH